jgi:hypothetical protein
MTESDRQFDCAVCDEQIVIPDDVEVSEFANWLEEEGWSRCGTEDDGQWMCEACCDSSEAGDEGD